MTDRIRDIDHLMINTGSAEDAGAAFEALGFHVTPLSIMPGLENRLICFKDTDVDHGICNYIELMALTDAAIAPPPMPELLSALEGPVSTVMAVDDADAVTMRLRAEGLRVGDVLHLSRDWYLGKGITVSPRFAVAIPAIGQTPFYWNYCQHKTPELYVRPDLTTHANGCTRLEAVLAVAKDPIAVANAQARLWQAEVQDGDPVRVACGSVALEIFSLAAFAARFAECAPGLRGLRLSAGSLDVAAEHIASARRDGDRLIVPPDLAAGAWLEIVGQDPRD